MMPTQSTPQLNSMYSQESLLAHAQAPQGAFAQPYQQPSGVHFPDEQMPAQQQQQQAYPDVASMSGYGGALPFLTPSEYDYVTAQRQQQQYQEQQYQQQPFTPQPAATAWEQQNVYEVSPQAPQQTQPQPQATDPTLRSLELTQARQRISALEAAREQQDTQLALQISAREAGGEAAEREEREVHETLLRSLDSYERDLRRGLDGDGDDWYADVDDYLDHGGDVADTDTDAFEEMSATTAATEVGTATTTTSRPANLNHAHNNRSTASTPIPITTNPALHPGPSPLPPIVGCWVLRMLVSPPCFSNSLLLSESYLENMIARSSSVNFKAGQFPSWVE